MNLMPYIYCYCAGIGTVLLILLVLAVIDWLFEPETFETESNNETEH